MNLVPQTPLAALARGLLAGAAGTGAMTAWQELAKRLKGDADRDGDADRWEQAPAPAKVGKRFLEGLFRQRVGPEHIGVLTVVMHWTYGTAWGGVYGLVQETLRARPLLHGVVFGSSVWAMSYVQLVPMGIYEPPWNYSAKELAEDLSYHLVYGAGVALAYEGLSGGASRRPSG